MEESEKKGFMEWMIRVSEQIENVFIVKVVRTGLITMVPILMIGAFALVFLSFPVPAYQTFIANAAGGFFYKIFLMAYEATFGVMSLYMSLAFSVSFFTLKDPEETLNMWGVGSAMTSFMIMIGIWSDSFVLDDLGATSVFLAIITSLVSSEIFYRIAKRYTMSRTAISYGADSRLGVAMASLLPAAVTVGISALISYAVTLTSHTTVHEQVTGLFIAIFNQIDDLFAKGLCFIFLSSLLWLFGIHGGDCLQGVSDEVFVPLIDANIAAVASGSEPEEILCKPFFDSFILMGGCGSCICLFLAILFFSKNKGMKTIATTAGFTVLFNVSELLVFGLPIVFNPVMAVPFLAVPVCQYLITYGAMASGLVPHITSAVEWTTPVLISGYATTGSLAGSLLQAVNILVGVAIYAPFVKMMGQIKEDRESANREEFVQWYMDNEAKLQQTRLLSLNGIYGDIAKRMAMELKAAVEREGFRLFYQPQYSYEGKCIGVEALLRWPITEWLNVYPPLLIQLAKEQGSLLDMEERILNRAMSERERVFEQFGRGIKISVNVTGGSAADKNYWNYLKALWKKDPFTEGTLCIEVTEQDAIVFSEDVIEEFRSCKELGIKFAIDDFSAGQTSMEYLKNGIFDLLKLDGSLVRGVNDNPRCREIISSLVVLSKSLHIDCLAEYVENEAIRQTLHEVGCDIYQGYLYSPAVPLKESK